MVSEDGYMEAVKTKAIRKMVNQLCWEIRPDAVSSKSI
jgi:acyl-CoA oxidase